MHQTVCDGLAPQGHPCHALSVLVGMNDAVSTMTVQRLLVCLMPCLPTCHRVMVQDCGSHQLAFSCALWVYNLCGLPIALQPGTEDAPSLDSDALQTVGSTCMELTGCTHCIQDLDNIDAATACTSPADKSADTSSRILSILPCSMSAATSAQMLWHAAKP